jgi:ribosomal protein S18 acetylase RimI-like enzyme
VRVYPRVARLRDGRVAEFRSPDARDAQPSLAFIRQLSRESFRNLNHPALFFERMTVDAQAAFLEAALSHGRNFMISAWVDDVLAGNTNLAVEGSSFSTHAAQLGLGVLKAYQGLGLGRLLTENLIATAREIGITNLILRVRTFNDPAIRLYESIGFKKVGTLRGVALLPDGPADEHIYQRLG